MNDLTVRFASRLTSAYEVLSKVRNAPRNYCYLPTLHTYLHSPNPAGVLSRPHGMFFFQCLGSGPNDYASCCRCFLAMFVQCKRPRHLSAERTHVVFLSAFYIYTYFIKSTI